MASVVWCGLGKSRPSGVNRCISGAKESDIFASWRGRSIEHICHHHSPAIMTSNLHHHPAHIPAQQPFTWPCSIRIHQVSPIHNIRHDQQTLLNIPAKSFTSPLHMLLVKPRLKPIPDFPCGAAKTCFAQASARACDA